MLIKVIILWMCGALIYLWYFEVENGQSNYFWGVILLNKGWIKFEFMFAE
jgi:hypothetical protein